MLVLVTEYTKYITVGVMPTAIQIFIEKMQASLAHINGHAFGS